MTKNINTTNDLIFKIHTLDFSKEYIDILVSTDSLPQYLYEDPNSNDSFNQFFLTLLLEDSNNPDINKHITLKSITESDNLLLLSFRVPIIKHLKKFKNTANLYIDINKLDQKYRVICDSDFNLDPHFIYFKKNNTITYPISTLENYLSITSNQFKSFAKVDNINLTGNGIISIEGYHITPNLQTSNEKSLIKTLIVKSLNDDGFEIEIPSKSVHTPNIHNYYSNMNSDLSWTGFKSEFNIEMLLNKFDDKSKTRLYLKLTSDNSSFDILPLSSTTEDLSIKKYIETESIFSKIHFFNNKKQSSILLNIHNYHNESAITSLNIESDSIYIDCAKPKNHKNTIKQAYIVISNRNTSNHCKIPLNLDNNSFAATLNISDLIASDFFNVGVFDLYLEIDNSKYKLTNHNNGSNDIESSINLPSISFDNSKEYTFTVTPYYTKDNSLSLLCRPYVRTKEITSVKSSNDLLSIAGTLDIRTNTIPLSDIAGGYICVNAPYGEKYTLPVSWSFKEIPNSPDFDFEIFIQKKYLQENNLTLSDFINSSKFDLITCTLAAENTTSQFLMYIDTDKIKSKLDSRISFKDKLSLKSGSKFYKLFNKLLPINNKLAMFQNLDRYEYDCNPKAIYELMSINKTDLKYVWVLNNDIDNINISGEPIIVKPNSFKYYYYLAVSKYFISNNVLPEFYEKRAGTVYLQTGTSFNGVSKCNLPKDMNFDYIVSPNQLYSNLLLGSNCSKESIINCGYPKNDLLVNSSTNSINKIKEYLNIPLNKKIILYMPNTIDDNAYFTEEHSIYQIKFNLDKFKELFEDDYVLLLKLNNSDLSKLEIHGYENLIYNVSSHNENELYLISDLLITDYSYSIFNFAILDKPILFFDNSLDDDTTSINEFYSEITKELPGPILNSDEELFNAIENISSISKDYSNAYQNFKDMFCSLDNGDSSEIIINTLFKQ